MIGRSYPGLVDSLLMLPQQLVFETPFVIDWAQVAVGRVFTLRVVSCKTLQRIHGGRSGSLISVGQ